MKNLSTVNKLKNENEEGSSPVNKERGLRYLFWLLIAVIIVSVFSMIKNVYCSSPGFESFLDSVNNSNTIYFDQGKYELKSEAFPIIDKIAGEMTSNMQLILNIKGFTDDKGSDEFNIDLSMKRAGAVRDYLTGKGIDPGRLITSWVGESEPANNNSGENDRALNRKVEFSITGSISETASNEIDKSDENKLYDEIMQKNQFINSNLKVISREEITADLSIRDSAGVPVDSIKDEDVSAKLEWNNNGVLDSTEGTPRLIPINDKKKIAFTLTMDYSGSMFGTESQIKNTPKSDKILAMEKSVGLFIDKMGNNMFCKIIKFGSKVLPSLKFTKSKEVLRSVLEDDSYNMGGTALYSSIYTALSDTTYSSNPTVMKTVIAFTDGMENSSDRVTLDSIFRKSELLNTKVFTVGLYNDVGNYRPSLDEVARRKIDMLKIAHNTGGFFYQASEPEQLNEIYRNIFEQVMKSYSISIVWNSANLPPKGTNVKAELKIKVKGATRVVYMNYIME